MTARVVEFTLDDYRVPGKAAPRVVRLRGGRSMAFNSAPTADAMAHVAAECLSQWRSQGPLSNMTGDLVPMQGPLGLYVRRIVTRGAKTKQKERSWDTRKPDGDNVLKLVADALVKAGVGLSFYVWAPEQKDQT